MTIADTGYWLALLNPKDTYHARALEVSATVKDPLITTWPVLAETCYFLLTARGSRAQSAFIDSMIAEDFQVFRMPSDSVPRISYLLKKYADLPMDLADASLVILAEHLSDGRILSTDQRDFNTYRWKNREPFENLMFPT